MGRWLEVLGERLPDDEAYLETHPEIVFDEIAPHPLIYATRSLPHSARRHFPTLGLLRIDSEAWDGEDQWLNPDEVQGLLDDLRRLRRLCRHEEFLSEVNAEEVLVHWRGDDESAAFEQWLDELEAVLQRAVEKQNIVHVML